jgi:hypothetical protein
MQDATIQIVDAIARFISHSTHDPMPQCMFTRTMRQAEDLGDRYRMHAMRLLLNAAVVWDTSLTNPCPYSWKAKLLKRDYKVTEFTNNLPLIQLPMSLITSILPRNSWKCTLVRGFIRMSVSWSAVPTDSSSTSPQLTHSLMSGT